MSHQLPLAVTNGRTIMEDPDAPRRLPRQRHLVLGAMLDGEWWTIPQLEEYARRGGVRATPQGLSARIRDLRKERWGGHTVERECIGSGVFRYRLIQATNGLSSVAGLGSGVAPEATPDAR